MPTLDFDCSTLQEMYDAGPLPLPRPYAEALHRLTLRERPDVALEVGCAMGSAALSICHGLAELGKGKLISIDPFQATDWRNQAVNAIRDAGLTAHHELLDDFDYLALPELVRGGQSIQLAYIDGMHTFDYTLLDAFYVDKLLDVGGVVGFNDCGWPAVHRAIRCLLAHRSYEEIDVGLEPSFAGRFGLLGSSIKRIQGRRNNDRYFRKLDRSEPPTTFQAKF